MMASPCFVGLLVLLLLRRVSADGSSLLLLTSCGFDRLSYTETSDGLFEFLAGEEPVDRYLFCGAVASGCLSHGVSQGLDWGRIGDQYCLQYLSSSDPARSNSLAVELRPIAARKFLLQLPRHMSIHSEHSRFQEERVKDHGDLSSSGKVLFAIPAAFICCCAFLCPCFRTKDKEVAEQPVLQEMRMVYRDSDSFESSRHSGRTPRTPLRAPPSPLRVPGSPSRFSLSPRLSRVGSVHLNLSQITKATQNFSESHRIGEGGSGTVYKAKLPDGQTVAIKRARKDHFANLRSEFSSEVELLSQIEHRNLVKLLGYIEKGNERIIISEFVPNGTLREHLDGQNGKFLDFNQRLGIAIDVAHGLTYLHLYAEKPVIHRDVKSSNILLTESMRAKVADFGFARNGPTNEDQTHISTKVKGTAGYVDPEYLKTYKLTTKSDVFSYGILLLEIISGRRPVEMRRVPEERITVRWAFKKYTQGRMRDILDPNLQENVHGEGLSRILGLAFECAAPTRPDRPTMKQVVERLWEIRKEYGGRHTTGR